jgi:hypothetical protein
MTTAWQDRLDEASSSEDVLRIVSEFLSFWTTGEWQAIPEDCRPRSLQNAQQVNAYAFLLARRLTGSAKTDPGLHRLSTFFTKASLRIYGIAESEARSGDAQPERRRRSRSPQQET